MKKLLAMLLVVFTAAFVVSGCNNAPGADALVGTWEADMSTFHMSMMDEMDEAQLEQIQEMLATGALELTNNADGTFTSFNRSPSDGEEHTESGEWEVVESDGATHTIRTTQLEDSRGADEVDGTPSDVDLEFLDRNTLLLSSDEGGQTFSVQMTRQ